MNQMSSTGNNSILQTCITNPRKHIENFFKELKIQIDLSFEKPRGSKYPKGAVAPILLSKPDTVAKQRASTPM